MPAWEDAGKQPHLSSERVTNPALDGLREELGDAVVDQFLTNYLALLDQRIAEIGQAIDQGKQEECITRLLTLETSSHMVGADELSLRAAALRLALGQRRPDTAMLYADLTRAGRSTRESLSQS
ncbi:MAG: Hpt domain-containing protein [Micropruina sp.]|uniref:hypothetical protein n=1 Tax=Micropruina sp. TaxID=2737536 RepID=UPI0039E51379